MSETQNTMAGRPDRLSLKPGDVLVLKTSLCRDDVQKLKAGLEAHLGFGVAVLDLAPGDSLSVLSKDPAPVDAPQASQEQASEGKPAKTPKYMIGNGDSVSLAVIAQESRRALEDMLAAMERMQAAMGAVDMPALADAYAQHSEAARRFARFAVPLYPEKSGVLHSVEHSLKVYAESQRARLELARWGNATDGEQSNPDWLPGFMGDAPAKVGTEADLQGLIDAIRRPSGADAVDQATSGITISISVPEGHTLTRADVLQAVIKAAKDAASRQ